MRRPYLTGAIVIAQLAASPLLAKTSNVVSRSVSMASLDLTTPGGQREWRRRLGRAITEICGEYPAAAQPYEVDRLNACRKAAKRDVDRQLAGRKGNAVYALAALR